MKTKAELLALSELEVFSFGVTLTTINPLKLSPKDIEKIKDFICSDGCTGVPNFYIDACIIHDFYYRTHRNFLGIEITKSEADYIFRKVIQKESFFKALSPMSWWRWLGVKFFANKAWDE